MPTYINPVQVPLVADPNGSFTPGTANSADPHSSPADIG
jgi:hypothetical protein